LCASLIPSTTQTPY
ncbi:hypothetical protein LINGRAHAP2_LOCUS11849, partial [Linum grandiflorum]